MEGDAATLAPAAARNPASRSRSAPPVRSSAGDGLRSSHVETIRASDTSSGDRQATVPVPSPPRSAARVRSATSSTPPERAPVDDAPADQPQRVVARAPRVGGEHQARTGVRRGHRAQALQQPAQALAAAPQPRGPLEALGGRGRAHLPVDVGQQRGAAVAAPAEQREGLVEAAAVEVRVEVAQARRQAAPHLAVGARPLAARQPAPAVAQAEQRVELLEQLDGRRAAAQRADRHAAPLRRRVGDLEHREGDVQAAAQVDVAVGVALQARVARRAQAAHHAALEQQRAELGDRVLVLDRLGLGHPPALGRRGGEVRPRARAHAHRLADVDDLPGGVAHDVDAGLLGEVREVGHPAMRAADARRGAVGGPRAPAARARGTQQRERVGDRRRVRAEPREQRAEHARARLGVGERAVGDLDLDPQRLGQRRELALARERMQAAGQRDRAQHRRRRATRRRRARRPGRSTRRSNAALCATSTRSRSSSASSGSTTRRGRRLVDHRLGDPGEALDPARERRADRQQRLPAVVQLAPADEHRAHLGHLARVAAEPVRLGVDDEELRGVQGPGEIHLRWSTPPSGRCACAVACLRGEGDRRAG